LQYVKLAHLHTGLSSMSICATEAYAEIVYVTSLALHVKILSVNIQNIMLLLQLMQLDLCFQSANAKMQKNAENIAIVFI